MAETQASPSTSPRPVVRTWTVTVPQGGIDAIATCVTARKDGSMAAPRFEGIGEFASFRIANIVCDAARAAGFEPPWGVVVSASVPGALLDPGCLLAVTACALAADGQVPEPKRLANMVLIGVMLENGTCEEASPVLVKTATEAAVPGSRVVSASLGVSLSMLHDGPSAFADACDSLTADPPLRAWAVTFERTEQVTLRVAAMSREEASDRAADLVDDPDVVEMVERALDAETGRCGAFDEWYVEWSDVVPLSQAAPDKLLKPPASTSRDRYDLAGIAALTDRETALEVPGGRAASRHEATDDPTPSGAWYGPRAGEQIALPVTWTRQDLHDHLVRIGVEPSEHNIDIACDMCASQLEERMIETGWRVIEELVDPNGLDGPDTKEPSQARER